MYIDSPQWKLKQQCPCCKEGDLDLYACERCNKVVAICNEIFTVFVDPLDITKYKISERERDVCPNCGAVEKFRRAKDFEIIALGLTRFDYE